MFRMCKLMMNLLYHDTALPTYAAVISKIWVLVLAMLALYLLNHSITARVFRMQNVYIMNWQNLALCCISRCLICHSSFDFYPLICCIFTAAFFISRYCLTPTYVPINQVFEHAEQQAWAKKQGWCNSVWIHIIWVNPAIYWNKTCLCKVYFWVHLYGSHSKWVSNELIVHCSCSLTTGEFLEGRTVHYEWHSYTTPPSLSCLL